MIRSNRRQVMAALDGELRKKNAAAGIVLENNIKKSIRDKKLVDTGRYLGSITSDSDESGAIAGTNVTRDGFSYPLIQEIGGRYIRPTYAMRTGAMNSIGDLRRIYGE